MKPYEALTSALGMLMQEAPLRRAKIGDVDDQDTHRAEVIDTLSDLVLMFEPYKGDDPKEAQGRKGHMVQCTNCDLTFPRMYAPAPLDRTARIAQRANFCPRCHATEGIKVAWDATAGATEVLQAKVAEFRFQRIRETLTYAPIIKLAPISAAHADRLESRFKAGDTISIIKEGSDT